MKKNTNYSATPLASSKKSRRQTSVVRSPLTIGTFTLLTLALTGFGLMTGTARAQERKSRKIPDVDLSQYPKNLHRNHLDADVEIYGESPRTDRITLSEETEDTNKAPIALLADDPTTGYPIAKGETDLILTLQELAVVRTVEFLNQDVAGTMSIYGSDEELDRDSSDWKLLRANVPLSGKVFVQAKLPLSELKYMKVSFNATQEGRIAGFATFGDQTIEDFVKNSDDSLRAENSERTRVDYDFASLYAGARIRYASSSTNINDIPHFNDDSVHTSASFSPDDELPTFVVDLGRQRNLDRITVITSDTPGKIEIYLRDAKSDEGYREGGEEDNKRVRPTANIKQPRAVGDVVVEPPIAFWHARNPKDGALLAQVANKPVGIEPTDDEEDEYAPIARVKDEDGVMRKSATFDKRTARFVMIRFKPEEKTQAVKGPFTVYDVSAFGDRSEDRGVLGAAITTQIIPEPLRRSLATAAPAPAATPTSQQPENRVPPSSP